MLRGSAVFLAALIALGALAESASAQGKFPGGPQGANSGNAGGASYGGGRGRRRYPPGPVISPEVKVVPGNRSVDRRKSQDAARRTPSGAPPAGERRLVPNEVLAQVQNSITQQALDGIAQRNRLALVETQSFELTGSTIARWRIPDRRSVAAVIRQLENDPAVIAAQPNYLYSLRDSPIKAGAAGNPAPYERAKLLLPQAQAISQGDNVLIALLDSGIDQRHPDLAGSVAAVLETDKHLSPLNKHGTSVAGLIVAHGRLIGAAPKSRLLSARVLDFSGVGGTSDAMRGVEWASKNGARIINMSFTGPQDPFFKVFLDSAYAKGIVLIAAVGNSGPSSPPLYPAGYPNVIGVTATDAMDKLFDRANRGGQVAVAAPGVDVTVAIPGGGYDVATGTSYAAPQVSGVVALLLEHKPHLTPDQVRAILQSTAKDLGKSGPDPLFGAGLVNALDALKATEPPVTARLPASAPSAADRR